MTISRRQGVASLMAITFFVFISPAGAGFSVQTQSDLPSYAAAAIHPAYIVPFILAIILRTAAYGPMIADHQQRRVAAWRRVVAFLLNLVTLAIIFLPLPTLLILVGEAIRTGEWNNVVERQGPLTWGARFALAMMLALPVVAVVVIARNAMSQKLSFGHFMMGYQIVPNRPKPSPMLRGILWIVGLFAWPVTLILLLRNKERQTFVDRHAGYTAVRLSTVERYSGQDKSNDQSA